MKAIINVIIFTGIYQVATKIDDVLSMFQVL